MKQSTAKPVCACCGQTIRASKPKLVAPVDVSTLSDSELIAYYKRIGIREDCRFFLQYAPSLPADLRAQAEALLAQLLVRASKPADAKALNRIKDTARALRPWPVLAQVDIAA